MDLIRRGEHQSGTCLSRGCRNAVRWKQRIHRQWHRPLLDRAGESLGEAGMTLPWRCTRELGHQGQHIAGTGECVAAVRDS
jgi:hypothetical protein